VLQALRDHCWLVGGPEPGSLRMLFVLRRFVEHQPIHRDTVLDARERHLGWAARQAAKIEAELRGADPAPSCAWMRRHADNLRAAERFGVRQSDPDMRTWAATVLSAELAYCQIVGGARLLAADLDAVLADDGLVHAPSLAVRLGRHRAQLAMREGDLQRAREEIARCAALSEGVEPTEQAAVLVTEAHLDALHGRHAEALAIVEAGLEQARERQDEPSELVLREALVDVTRQAGRFAAGREHGERALELLGPKRSLAHAPLLTALSFIASESGAASAAAAFAQRGLGILDELGVDRTRTRIGLELARARAFHLDGEVAQAVRGCDRAREHALVNGDADLVGYAELAKASALLELRRTAEARELFASAVLRLGTRNPYGAVGAALLAACEALLGDADQAERRLSARDSLDPAGAPPPFAKVAHVVRAAVAYLARRDGDAEAVLRELADSAMPRKGGAPIELRALRSLALQALVESPRDRASPRLVLGPEGRWYRVGEHPIVVCERRPVMRRILLALAEAWTVRTGTSLSKEELRRAGWPGERMREASAQRRLEVMISRMRQLGLRDVLETTELGYRLRPDCEVLNDGRRKPP
jgi:ATP/maltotriose-dependent transcriptional regulator MalT